MIREHYYKTIMADPPWPERGGGKIKRGADKHYPLMSVEDISRLDVSRFAHPDGCHLYLWVTNNYLEEGLGVMRAWGFRYVTKITWGKPQTGIGQYFRGCTEDCLFGVRGSLPYRFDDEGKRQQGRTLLEEAEGYYVIERRHRHSQKPSTVRRWVEEVSHPPRLEMFARIQVEGWDAWGDEAEVKKVPEGRLF